MAAGWHALIITHYALPEGIDAEWFYAGVIICSLIPLFITWNDPPDFLERLLAPLIKWCIPVLGVLFFIWGVGMKLELWGNSNPDGLGSLFDTMMPNIALLTGPLVGIYLYLAWRMQKNY